MSKWIDSSDIENMDRLLVNLKQFKWAGTPDGHLFWNSVYERLTRMRKKALPHHVTKKLEGNTRVSGSLYGTMCQFQKIDAAKLDRSMEYACDCLLFSFNWEHAPGGNAFWDYVYKRLCPIKYRRRSKARRAARSNV